MGFNISTTLISGTNRKSPGQNSDCIDKVSVLK